MVFTKKKLCLISIIAFIAIIGSIFYLTKAKPKDYKNIKANKTVKSADFASNSNKNISVTNLKGNWSIKTKYFDKNTEHTLWVYHYTEKFDSKKKAWDFNNTDTHVLLNGQWVIEDSNETKLQEKVSSVTLKKRPKGAYLIQVIGQEKNKHEQFFDRFLIDCAKSQVTEGDF